MDILKQKTLDALSIMTRIQRRRWLIYFGLTYLGVRQGRVGLMAEAEGIARQVGDKSLRAGMKKSKKSHYKNRILGA